MAVRLTGTAGGTMIVSSGGGTMAGDVRIKRVYDDPDAGDGYRVLIDRLWPRGISKEHARLDEWARELAPSDELRKWFGHVPERFPEFRDRYRQELAAQAHAVDELRRRSQDGPLTLVYGARDREHNDAVVLAELIRER
jgi:uncharacterized protein YeaO (DUF488 family)